MVTGMTNSARAQGIATVTHNGTVLDVWYPAPKLGEPVDSTGTVRIDTPDARFAHLAGPDEDRGVARVQVELSLIHI